MDADRIDKLTGRELDVAVAEARGWEVFRSKQDYFDKRAPHAAEFNTNVGYPAYYDAAFKLACVVPNWQEAISAAIPLLLEMMSVEPRNELVRFCNGDGDSYDIDAWRGNVHMSVDTEAEIPEMICRAWLKWMEAPDD